MFLTTLPQLIENRETGDARTDAPVELRRWEEDFIGVCTSSGISEVWCHSQLRQTDVLYSVSPPAHTHLFL